MSYLICILIGAILVWVAKQVGHLISKSEWFRYQFEDPFTVAHDYSMFANNSHNSREELEQVSGFWAAKACGEQWILEHPSGQYRVLRGHHKWRGESGPGSSSMAPPDDAMTFNFPVQGVRLK